MVTSRTAFSEIQPPYIRSKFILEVWVILGRFDKALLWIVAAEETTKRVTMINEQVKLYCEKKYRDIYSS
jgi:hypothetical protein